MWISSTMETIGRNNNLNIANKTKTLTESSESNKDTKNNPYKTSNTSDMLEISAEAYKMQLSQEKISAASGKDSLRITRRSKNSNKFVIHFTDSAQISRTIQRGYITVNGIRIDLSDTIKDKLKEADEQAQTDRETLFALQTAQQDMAAAKQQAEAIEEVFENETKMMEIARRISKGGKVPSYDEQKLLEYNADMYMMAKNAGAMAKSHEEYDSLFENEEEPNDTNSEYIPDKKSYEVQMNVSMDGTPEVQDISEVEIEIN